MPNWCMNAVEWQGNPEDVSKCTAFVKTKENQFDFNQVLPYPKKFRDLDDKVQKMRDENADWKDIPTDGYNSGGYDWCIANWGTKWNACEAYTDDGYSSFDTAWSPPLPVIEKLSKMFPTLRCVIRFEEGGMDFSGIYVFENGMVTDSKEGGYDDFPMSEHCYYCHACGMEIISEEYNFEKGMCRKCADKAEEVPE